MAKKTSKSTSSRKNVDGKFMTKTENEIANPMNTARNELPETPSNKKGGLKFTVSKTRH
ncbi:MAG: hypothetical protein ABJA71_05590 [Ginsengibacter sp.]